MEPDSSYGQLIRLPKPRAARAEPRGESFALRDRSLTDVLLARPFDPSATAFVLSAIPAATGPVLWVRDRPSERENGRLYAPGLRAFGLDRPILHVTANNPRDVLWTMEEGAACAGLSAVIGEIHGAPSVLDFTATKRLALRAEASGVPLWLIRSGDPGTLSAARERWRIGALPSDIHPFEPRAPGGPRWDADLFRARNRPPGRWVAVYEPGAPRRADRLRLVSRSGDGSLAPGQQPVSDAAGA